MSLDLPDTGWKKQTSKLSSFSGFSFCILSSDCIRLVSFSPSVSQNSFQSHNIFSSQILLLRKLQLNKNKPQSLQAGNGNENKSKLTLHEQTPHSKWQTSWLKQENSIRRTKKPWIANKFQVSKLGTSLNWNTLSNANRKLEGCCGVVVGFSCFPLDVKLSESLLSDSRDSILNSILD